MQQVNIRPIQPNDNAAIASIIRSALEEFNANKPGTVYFDPTTDHLFELFREPRSAYFVLQQDAQILGGAGIFPTSGLPTDTCELVKMYLAPIARGKGYARLLVQHCVQAALAFGYQNMYLETLPELSNAVTLYEHLGFHYLQHPLGNSGHTDCNLWMMKTLH